MAMMPLMPDLDHSHLDPSWCTSSASSLAAAAAHQWIHPSLMNYNDDHISNCNENWKGGLFLNQKEIRPVNTTPIELANLNPSLNQVMAQDLVLPANSIQDYNDHIQQEAAAARLQYTLKIKEEMSQDALPRLYEAIREHYQIIDEKLFTRALQNSSHDLLLPYTDSDLMLMNNISSANRYANMPSGDNGSCNMALPCVNMLSNNLNSHLAPLPGILDTDLQAFDILATSRLNMMPFIRDDAAFGMTSTLIQQLAQGACTIQPKVPSLLTGVTAKRGVNNINNSSSSILENKAPPQSHQDMPRKSRLESRSPSCSSFKVRKEKLGDRIAALQQLVSPFGKTDTASVLMEAIGYINFLHDQVQTLSVPYLSLPKSKKQRTTAQGDANEDQREKESSAEERKMDLRSRGLCLVPLSCTSYVTSEITASHLNTTFSPPNFSFP